jgi:hypothetical protein
MCDRHVRGLAGERAIDHARTGGRQLLRLVAALARMRKLALVAHHRPGGVVELQIAAAGVVERAQRLAVGVGHVIEKSVEIGIGVLADRAAALAEMQHVGRRHGHFRHHPRVLLDEAEIVDVRMCGEADAAGHAHALGLGLDAVEDDAVADLIELDAVESLEEIELPPRAARLAVGGGLEPNLLLLSDRLLDLAVLDRAQRAGGELAALVLRPRLLERRRPQQAADVVGAEWRRLPLHRSSHPPCFAAVILASSRPRFSNGRHGV